MRSVEVSGCGSDTTNEVSIHKKGDVEMIIKLLLVCIVIWSTLITNYS